MQAKLNYGLQKEAGENEALMYFFNTDDEELLYYRRLLKRKRLHTLLAEEASKHVADSTLN